MTVETTYFYRDDRRRPYEIAQAIVASATEADGAIDLTAVRFRIEDAIEASRPKNTILLRFMKKLAEPDAFPHPPGTMLVLASVVDDGVGIPQENLDRLFDPFFTTKKGGTGLGLYITHDIVKRHGGALRVTSDPGRGTTFTIELPVEPIQEVEDGR